MVRLKGGIPERCRGECTSNLQRRFDAGITIVIMIIFVIVRIFVDIDGTFVITVAQRNGVIIPSVIPGLSLPTSARRLPTLHQQHFFGSDGDFVSFFVFGGDYGDDLMGDLVEGVAVERVGIGVVVFVAMTTEEGQDFGAEDEFGWVVVPFLVGLVAIG